MTIVDPGYVREGSTWPPVSESARVRRAESNLRLYRGDFTELNTEAQQATALRFQAGANTPQIRVTVNMFRWVSRVWPDLVFGQAPVLDYLNAEEDYAEGGEAVVRRLQKVLPSLVRSGRQVVKNCVRYGAGVWICRKPGLIESVDPRFWFPIVSAYDLNDVQGHIVAYPFVSDPNSVRIDSSSPRGTSRATGFSTPDKLRVYRFTMDGETWMCEAATFKYDGSTIGMMQDGWEQMACAQPPVHFVTLEGDDIYGESLFDDMRSHVAEINTRETALSTSLDKHADPHLAVPEGSLQVDAQGRAIVNKNGMAIFVPEGSENPEYVVWDPKYDAHVEAVVRAERRIASLAGISQLLVNVSGGGQQRIYLPSGVALRRLALITVQRIRSYRADLEDGMQQIVRGALSDRYRLEPDRVNVSWPPPLDDNAPDDTQELIALVDAGIVDRASAAQEVNRVPRREAEEIVERNPPTSSGFGMQPTPGAPMSEQDDG